QTRFSSVQFFNEIPCIVSLIFHKNKILNVGIRYSKDSKEKDWKEDLIKIKHDEWIIADHGSTSKRYPWGIVESVFDGMHSNLAVIGIRYVLPENEIYIKVVEPSNQPKRQSRLYKIIGWIIILLLISISWFIIHPPH